MADDIVRKIVITAEDQASPVVKQIARNFQEATQSIAALGRTPQEALNAAAEAAKKFGASAQDLQKVESVINSLAARTNVIETT